jgi:hypothetical protein
VERFLNSRVLVFAIMAVALAALLPRVAVPQNPDGEDDPDTGDDALSGPVCGVYTSTPASPDRPVVLGAPGIGA